MISEERALELISRRRRQVHVHSVIYYHMHTNIITDATFDAWSNELVSLQKHFPKSSYQGYMPGVFANWTGDTGMHLPVTDRVYALAASLLRTAENKNHVVVQTPKTERWKGDVGYEANS